MEIFAVEFFVAKKEISQKGSVLIGCCVRKFYCEYVPIPLDYHKAASGAEASRWLISTTASVRALYDQIFEE